MFSFSIWATLLCATVISILSHTGTISSPQNPQINQLIFVEQSGLRDKLDLGLKSSLMVSNYNMRWLQTSKREQNNSKNNEDDNDTLKIFLVVSISILLFLVIVICLIYCIRQMLKRGSGGYRGAGKIVNIGLNYDFIFPSLSYHLFCKQVGEPNCDECFENKNQTMDINQYPFTQKIPETQQQEDIKAVSPLRSTKNHFRISRKRRPKPQLADTEIKSQVGSAYNHSVFPENSTIKEDKEEFMIKLTVCGHILHANCLNDWIKREINCPLCRQSFELESIEKWQEKLNVDFQTIYAECRQHPGQAVKSKFIGKYKKSQFDKKKQSQQPSNQFQSTLSQLHKSNSRNVSNFEEFDENAYKQNIHKLVGKYGKEETYAMIVYRKIVEYHQGRINMNLQEKQVDQEQQKTEERKKKQNFIFQFNSPSEESEGSRQNQRHGKSKKRAIINHHQLTNESNQ